jgi:hypothetical protein
MRTRASSGNAEKALKAWLANIFRTADQQGNIKEFLFATNDAAYTDETTLKSLLDLEKSKEDYNRDHYLINLECKRCGHRISISDRIYDSDNYI